MRVLGLISLAVVIVLPVARCHEAEGVLVSVQYGDLFSGGNGGGETPVPIPNTVVKPSSADGTARETVWESRSLPV